MIPWMLSVVLPQAAALDLEEARSAAVTRAIAVQRQRALVDRARAVDLDAIASSLPQVGVFAEATAASGPNPFGRFTSRQVQVGVSGSWRLVDPATWGAAAAARSSLRGEQALLDWSRAMARRDATIRFAEAVAAVEIAEALRTAEEDAARAAEGSRSLTEAGLRPAAEAAQADAAAAALTAQRVAAEGEIGASCAALQAQIGLPIDGHCELVAPASWPEPRSTDERHPALRAAEAALRAARQSRGASVAAGGPAIVGTASAAQNFGSAVVGDGDSRDLSGTSLSAGLRADLPVMGSGSGAARVRSATADRTAAEVALDEQERLLTSGRVAAEARYAAALSAVDANVAASDAAEEALQLVSSRYEQGLAGLTTFLDARRARDQSLVEVARARADHARALAELEASRGIHDPAPPSGG